jgi:proline iminopeptidase
MIDRGLLDVGDGHSLAWSMLGARSGKPTVVLHGGPGQGSSPRMAGGFDLERQCVVLYDQRGCGDSKPHACDADYRDGDNTTARLVRDLDKLRAALEIDRWLVCGASWGATLALAYAEEFPSRVSELVLLATTTSTRAETAKLYQGLDVASLARSLSSDDARAREAAARTWCAHEDAVLAREPTPVKSRLVDLPPREMIALARICAQYALHGAFLEEGQLLRDIRRLHGIQGVIIHGALDPVCPVEVALDLAARWHGAELVINEGEGHSFGPKALRALGNALERFAE